MNLNYPKIAVIVAALNEEKYIGKCIESLLSQNYPGKIEIIIADGGSKDKTIAIVKDYQSKFKNITLLENEKKYPSTGRNKALKFLDAFIYKNDADSSAVKYAAYLDAHSFADENWLLTLYETFINQKKHDFKIAGVSSIYKNAHSSKFANTSEIALTSILSGATKNVFLNKKEISKVDNGYAILYDLDVLNITGYYNESLHSGEDIELNHRITKIFGYNLYVNPEAITYYYRPTNIFELARQQFKYGYWRLMVMKLLRIPNLKALVPSLLLIIFILLSIFGFFAIVFHCILLFLIIIYISAQFTCSLFIGIQKKCNAILLFLIFITIQISYGLGMLFGLFKEIKSR